MAVADVEALAGEIAAAYAGRGTVTPFTARPAGLTLDAAYAVEAELVRQRRAAGARTVGRKVGYANKAMWRVLKLDTLVFGHMYDDTVHDADGNEGRLSVASMRAPRIEPEIVFRMKAPMTTPDPEPGDVLAAVEWMALGFEIVDCVFPDWSFQPADFVAAYGLHAALVVGEPRRLGPDSIPTLVDELTRFTVTLFRNGHLVEQGSGRNALRSPALSLRELGRAIERRPGAEPLTAGEIVSTGTLTEAKPVAGGETWQATVDGLELPPLTLRVL